MSDHLAKYIILLGCGITPLKSVKSQACLSKRPALAPFWAIWAAMTANFLAKKGHFPAQKWMKMLISNPDPVIYTPLPRWLAGSCTTLPHPFCPSKCPNAQFGPNVDPFQRLQRRWGTFWRPQGQTGSKHGSIGSSEKEDRENHYGPGNKERQKMLSGALFWTFVCCGTGGHFYGGWG